VIRSTLRCAENGCSATASRRDQNRAHFRADLAEPSLGGASQHQPHPQYLLMANKCQASMTAAARTRRQLGGAFLDGARKAGRSTSRH
jgi:hypothetical protein